MAEPLPSRHELTERLFERQFTHLLALIVLLATVYLVAKNVESITSGSLGRISSRGWLWIVVGTAIAHQVYTWLSWRLELHARAFTRTFPTNGFRIYKAGFAALGLSRFLIVALAVANRGSLDLPVVIQWGLSGVFLVISGYLFYSVVRYFGINRAAGLDHFDRDARDWPMVTDRIFRFTSNGMYLFGFLAMWVPGLVLESAGALLAAGFHHAYIWVHYYSTEAPDMAYIYGDR